MSVADLMRRVGTRADIPSSTGLPAGTFMDQKDLGGLIGLITSYRGTGMTPNINEQLPPTRTFGGFLGSNGQVQPMGSYSQQALGLLGQHRNSQFLDPGAAWGQTQQQPTGIAPPPRVQIPAMPTQQFSHGLFGSPYMGYGL
jgi:hypothetical protein